MADEKKGAEIKTAGVLPRRIHDARRLSVLMNAAVRIIFLFFRVPESWADEISDILFTHRANG